MSPQSSEAAPAAHSVAATSAYQSNPFIVTADGLVSLLKVNPVASLLTGVVFVVALIVFVLVGVLLTKLSSALAVIILLAGAVLVVPTLVGAYTALAVASLRNEAVDVNTIYHRAVAKVFPTLGVVVLYALSILIPILIAAVIGGATKSPVASAIIIAVVAVLTYIIIGAWFSLSFFALYEENLGPVGAMKRSRELVQGHVMEMVGALVASVLMAGYGLGLLSPAVSVAPLAGRYQQLKALKAAGAPKPKVHWLNYLVFILIGLYVLLIVILSVAASHSSKNNDPFSNGYTFPTTTNDSSSSSDYFTN